MAMSAEFLGQGWRFPIGLDGEGRFALAAGNDSIEQAIWIILATAPGERIMRPDFGCGIHNLVFSTPDTATRAQLVETVRQSLIRWEPRIDLLDVNLEEKGRGELLLINISYRVRTTNNLFNMVYPFYLSGRSEE